MPWKVPSRMPSSWQARVRAGRRLVRPLAGLALALHLFHLLAQRQRSHVGPDFLDVGQALVLLAALADVVPAERILAMRGPYRVLLFVVDDHLVDRVVFAIFPVAHDPISLLGGASALISAALPPTGTPRGPRRAPLGPPMVGRAAPLRQSLRGISLRSAGPLAADLLATSLWARRWGSGCRGVVECGASPKGRQRGDPPPAALQSPPLRPQSSRPPPSAWSGPRHRRLARR